jgi:hypothetical protein
MMHDAAVNLDGKELIKIQLDWDYKNRKVHLSMTTYLQKALQQFNNIVPTKHQDSQYRYTEPKYDAKQQFAEYDTSAPVGKDKRRYVQKVTGKFNWYAQWVNGTMLTPISSISTQQAKPTQAMMKRVQHLLDYAATKEPTVTTYHASDMVLAIHSNAGYLNEEGARSWARGHHFLSENVANPSNDGTIYNKASIIKTVISTAAEVEIGAVYKCTQTGRRAKYFWGNGAYSAPHPHPNRQFDSGWHHQLTSPTKMHKSHGHAVPLADDWGINQKQFRFYWRPGTLQQGDNWTKHHPPSLHRQIRSEILPPYKVVMDFREKMEMMKHAHK